MVLCWCWVYCCANSPSMYSFITWSSLVYSLWAWRNIITYWCRLLWVIHWYPSQPVLVPRWSALRHLYFLLALSCWLFISLVGLRPTFEDWIQRCKEEHAVFPRDLMRRGCGMWSCILMHVMEGKEPMCFSTPRVTGSGWECVLKTRSTW